MQLAIAGMGSGLARNPGAALHARLWDRYLGPIAPWSCGRNCTDPSPARYDGSMTGVSSALSVTHSPIGTALKLSGNVGIQWSGHSTLGNKFKLAGAPDEMALTIQAYFRFVHKTTAGHRMGLFQSDVTTVGDPVGYQLHFDANADRMIFTVYDGTPVSAIAMEWQSGTGFLTPEKWHHFVMTMYAPDSADVEIGQRVMFWLDGVMSYPSETIHRNAIAFTNSLHSRLGGRQGGLDADLEVSLLSIWSRRLAWREVDQLYVDPLLMFRRIPRTAARRSPRVVSLGSAVLRQDRIVLAG